MMKALICILSIVAAALSASAQDDCRQIKQASDSIEAVFSQNLKGAKFKFTQLVKNPDNFFEDAENEITGDTIWMENYEQFRFYRTKSSGKFTIAEYYSGKIGELFECEKNTYYFLGDKLQMTVQLYKKHGDAIDEYGNYLFLEERRVLFNTGSEYPSYIFRDCEGTSDLLNIKYAPFKKYDVRKIIYDKEIFETTGYMIYNNHF